MIEDFHEFEQQYPDCEHLETVTCEGRLFERWSNGLGENTPDESVWFCKDCDSRVDDPLDGCPVCDADEDDED